MPHVPAQNIETHLLEPRTQRGSSSDCARVQQRLVFPGPGFLLLILGESVDAGHEHAAFATGPQTHVDLIEPAGSRMHRQQVNDPLCEPYEEQLVVDRAGAGCFLPLTARVVQKHEVEIRRVAQFHATELAVADTADRDLSLLLALAPMRRPELMRDLAPGQLHRPLHDQLGHFGEPVADSHHGQSPRQVGHRQSEDRRALELPEGFDLMLRFVVLHMAHSQLELFLQCGAIGQVRQQTLVDQLVQQQWMGGDLAG